jgi:hypothetical protein
LKPYVFNEATAFEVRDTIGRATSVRGVPSGPAKTDSRASCGERSKKPADTTTKSRRA